MLLLCAHQGGLGVPGLLGPLQLLDPDIGAVPCQIPPLHPLALAGLGMLSPAAGGTPSPWRIPGALGMRCCSAQGS